MKVAEAVEGSRRHRGTLLEATEQGIVLAVQSPHQQRIAIDYPNIQRSHLVAAWGVADAPQLGAGKALAGRPKPNDRARSRAGATRKSADAGIRVASGGAPEPKDA